jgi:hypothetical protein
MRIVRYVIFLNIFFFSCLFIIVILTNLLMYFVGNEIILLAAWISGIASSLWLSHHISKRMVFRGLPWKESIVDSFKKLEII